MPCYHTPLFCVHSLHISISARVFNYDSTAQHSTAQRSAVLLSSQITPAWSFVNEIIEGFASKFVMNRTKLSAWKRIQSEV